MCVIVDCHHLFPSSWIRIRAPPCGSDRTGSGLRLRASFRIFYNARYEKSTSRFIPSASPFSSRFTSSSTAQLISVIIRTLVIHHSFTLSFQAQNLTFQQILSTVDFFYLLDCLTTTGLDRPITLIILFLVLHFNFLFVPCGRLSWLPVSSLLHVKYTLSYRIVSYRIRFYVRDPEKAHPWAEPRVLAYFASKSVQGPYAWCGRKC